MIIELEDAKRSLSELADQIKALGEHLGISSLESEREALESEIHADGFWDTSADDNAEYGAETKADKAQKILKKSKALADKIDEFRELERSAKSALELCEMAIDGEDNSVASELTAEVDKTRADFAELELKTLLDGEYDSSSAIVTIHPGAGGTEAQDWAEMLWRMYTRYGEKHHFKVKTLDYLEGDGAGIKSVTFSLSGKNAFGYLKSENGVHRMVRISPFDAAGKRHTSFASVEVVPEMDEELYKKIEIKSEDIRVETHRASGAGGQHINKTDSAVRIIHIPTNIIVGCQSERSQVQNKETCMKMLKSRLLEIKEREHLEKIDDIKGEKNAIEWGSQIRSYVFMPYTLVSDKRTGFESGNVNAVMDGEIDGFIKAYLSKKN
ncbi:peptide chain release factor 2 [Clostridia bacterium]|nr:peptide chain release factor 2 [Clostridia bacterium]